jgi:2'-5' RNA ligase
MITETPDALRVFCALTLDEAAEAAVKKTIAGPKAALDSFRWTPAQNWHVTLKFFGDLHPSAVDDLGQAMTQAAASIIPIQFKSMGAFPNLQRPRVLWVGVNDLNGDLGALQERFEECCVRLSFERERREYRPHLTVARPKRSGAAPAVRTLEPLWDLPAHSAVLSRLVLFSSEINQGGRVYRPLREVILQGNS